MSQPRLLALLAALAMVVAPLTADARGGGGGPSSGMGGFGGSRFPTTMGGTNRPDTFRDDMREIARSIRDRDSVGRPKDSRARSAVLDTDDRGAAIVRGEIIAVAPTEADLAAARSLNFTIRRQDDLEALGLSAVTLLVPKAMTTVEALAALRRASPGGTFDFAHVYGPTGESQAAAVRGGLPALLRAKDVSVGMIDGGIARRHRALRGATMKLRSFAGGHEAPPTVHGTAIASLLIGEDGDFSGHLPGARLYAADVFGGTIDGGSADTIARALNWLAENDVPVSNISLAGPPNALLAAAVKAFIARGHVLVAAVGNDGPAAAPNYPASYPGVVAVTSVDSARRLAFDANRTDVGFAALGVEVRAANLPEGYAGFSGTSYAAPAVTAGLARLLPKPDAAGARAAFETLMNASARLNGAGQIHLIESSLHSAAGMD